MIEMASGKAGEIQQSQIVQSLVSNFLNSCFYHKTNGNLLRSFKQTCDMVRFAMKKEFRTKQLEVLTLKLTA